MKFDSEKVKNDMLQWIREWFDLKAKGRKAVVGISGGRDSAISAAMFTEALGKDNVIGVILPYRFNDDINDAVNIVKYLDIEFHVIHIKHSFGELRAEVREDIGPLSEETMINMLERIRVAALWGVANNKKGIFVNSSNYSEDWLGYFTQYGDIAPFIQLTTCEVKELGKVLRIPNKYIDYLPSDGLCGLIDEELLGFKYEELDNYIRYGIEPDKHTKEKIDKQHESTMLRREPVGAFVYK